MGTGAKLSAVAMLENTLRSLDCPISANHCEVFMQGQIRQERAQLDFYTLK